MLVRFIKEHKVLAKYQVHYLCDRFLGILWNNHVGSLARGEEEDDKRLQNHPKWCLPW